MHRLVPDFILERFASGQVHGALPAAAMFVDVSGFSTITDTLMQHGQHGAEVLADVMRTAFTPLIQIIYEQKGFLINQAGDSFTALFPLENDEEKIIPHALTAACLVQSRAAAQPAFDTPYGQFAFSVKIGLSRGEASWGILTSTSGERAAYYFRGSAINGCAEAEHHARPGEIIVDNNMITVVQGKVQILPRGHFYCLQAIDGELPEPVMVVQPEVDLALASRFFPKSLLTGGVQGEFRQIVCLFINLPTVRTEEQLEILMQIFFQLQERYDGLLSRLSFGDKGSYLLVFWGAPAAHENDLERALNFFLELQAQTEIPVNGGITYRIAHAGYVGSDLYEEYTGYGRGVNLAARFMTSSDRGELWLDKPAAWLARARFELEDLGEKPFKGFANPQKVFLLLERKEQIELAYEGELAGREEELTALQHFVQPVFSGKYAGVLVIWGEPGMGKSRLVHEFLKRLGNEEIVDFQIFLAQCDEILRQSLNPFRYWLQRYFDQSMEHSDARNKRNFNRKLDNLIAITSDSQLAGELDRTRSCLGALIGLEWSDSLYQQLDAQGRYENTLAGLAILLMAESHKRPVIFLLEDAHWMDADSKIFMPRLFRLLAGDETLQSPVAFVINARLEGKGLPLETFPYYEIQLGGLSRDALANLASANLGYPVGSSLLDLLLRRAEGNPFFAEQILRYLQEEGWLKQRTGEVEIVEANQPAAALPETIQSLLVARLDHLAEDVRQVVQTAAVLGREFEVRLLAEMLKEDTALSEKVEQAEQASVWVALNVIRYIFRHALLRDTAYNMQVQARRQALHALAVEGLERLYMSGDSETGTTAKSSAQYYSELAYHCEQAELREKAFDYLLKAGETALEAYQNNDAANFYTRALTLLDQDKSSPNLQSLYIGLGQSLERTGQYEQALSTYRELAELAQKRDDPRLELASLMAQSIILSIETNVQDRKKGVEIAKQALKASRAQRDRKVEAKALHHLGQALAFSTQDPNQFIPYIEQSVALARELDFRDLIAEALNLLSAFMIFHFGQFEKGQALVEEAISIWQELGRLPRLSEAFQNSALANMLSGQYDQAIRRLEAVDEINTKIGSAWGRAFCAELLGTIYWELGEYSQAMNHMARAVHLGEESGYLMAQVMGRATLGMVYGHLGRISEGIELCRQAVELGQSKAGAFAAQSLASLAWVYVLDGNLTEAEEAIHAAWQALDQRISFPIEPNYVAVVEGYLALAARDWPRLSTAADRAMGMITAMHNRFLAVDAVYLQGQALLAQGQVAEARSLFRQACADAEAIGCRRMLWPILITMNQIETDPAKAQLLLEQAREIVSSISSQIRKPEWQASFLNQGSVKTVFDPSIFN